MTTNRNIKTRYYAILDHEGNVFGYWQGHFHCVWVFTSQKAAIEEAIDSRIPGYKISIAEEAMRRSQSKYSTTF